MRIFVTGATGFIGRHLCARLIDRGDEVVAMVRTPERAAASIFGYTNQLDAKQYRQMTAPAFVCSSERIRRELGWAPRHDLADALTNAAIGYQSAGLLPRR